MISKMKRAPLREVWKKETDFTKWLKDNIDVLGDAIDLELTDPEIDQAAGDFVVDLVAETQEGAPVVIENQFGGSDHDHLGKLITYLTAIEAGAAIWIVEKPRPEHVAAVAWLNASSSGRFYLVKLEAVRIDTSNPAPLLTLIVGPSEEATDAGVTKKEIKERHVIRKQFWEELLERAAKRTSLHAGISASTDNHISTGAGMAYANLTYVIRKHDANVELWLNGTKDECRQLYDRLNEKKNDIEKVFGGPLTWDRVEGRQGIKIKSDVLVGGYRDKEKWPEIHDAMIDAMVRLEKAIKPYLSKS
jgi:frataxin-like iron-binding protein CyaY